MQIDKTKEKQTDNQREADTPSSDSVMKKMSYEVDVLHRPASNPIFFYWVG